MICARYWLCTAPLILAGCQTLPPERIEIPIPVPCAAQIPDRPAPCTPPNQTDPELLRCILIDANRLAGYAAALEAELLACVGR